MAAEHGAHITSTTTTHDIGSPSIFEVLAQENLMNSLRPALKHIARIVAEKNPSCYSWLAVYSDELYTFLDLLLQKYYLKKYYASFAENFYSLKRLDVNEKTMNLTTAAQKRSLFFLVVFPYLRLKCDSLYEKWKERYQRNPAHTKTVKNVVLKLFLRLYPIVHSVWEAALLICLLAYVFGKIRVHSPLLWLSGVCLSQLTLEDINQQNIDNHAFENISNKRWYQKLGSIFNYGAGNIATVMTNSLSFGVFFLQFLEWWYSSDQLKTSLTSLPNPPPPKEQENVDISHLPSICPICQRFRSNDTALAVSGYVFCYPCIYKYVKENNCCPVTKYPASTKHLIKLYVLNS